MAKCVRCVETDLVFDTFAEAGRYSGTTGPNIGKQIKCERKSAGKDPITGEKLHWEYVDKTPSETINTKSYGRK